MKIETLKLEQVTNDPHNPRKDVDKEEVELLMKSMETEGQLEPIHVEEIGKNSYITVEGGTRLAAAKKSKKIKSINAIVSRKLSKEERLFKQISIDTHRKNWSNNDRDAAWERLWNMGKYTNETFAKKISVSKAVIERFRERVSVVDKDTRKKLTKISGSNIDEAVMRLKDDKKLLKKVLTVADKKELGRIEMRKFTNAAKKVSTEVLDDYAKGKISIDDVENMSNMDKKSQDMALSSTKFLNSNKKQLKKMIEGKKITTETKAVVLTSSQKITMMQEKFFKLSSELRNMENLLNSMSAAEEQMAKAHMDKILLGVIDELERQVLPSIKNFKKVLTRIRK